MDPTIFHVDLDAFFASVEQLDHPELRGKPVIIGGDSNRGVVATASYEARRYGVHSAMAMVIAKKKCPQAVIISGNYKRYQDLSRQVFGILKEMATQIEQVSIDEAYLDMSDLLELKSDTDCGRLMQSRIYEATGLTLSVGISYNKFLAKLASDWNKPHGLMRIDPSMIPEILLPLPLSKIHGLGQKSVSKLNRIGIFSVSDLYGYSEDLLESLLGKYGRVVYQLIRGVDHRSIEVVTERKSYGKETTFEEDTVDKEVLKSEVRSFCQTIDLFLKRQHLCAKRITLKYKTCQHESHTKSKTMAMPLESEKQILEQAFTMIDELTIVEPIRLIGLSVSVFESQDLRQLSVFEGLTQFCEIEG